MFGHTFFEYWGFSDNPFSSTNSETEESLAEYFVPPPYFETVKGLPSSPKSAIVFAPRGSGKTAQRRMIELSALQSQDFICLSYVDFRGLAPSSVMLADHQKRISLLLVTAILGHLDDRPAAVDRLGPHEKRILKISADTLLAPLDQQDFESALGAVKSLGDKANDFWHRYGGVVAVAISGLMKKFGLDGVDIPTELSRSPSNSGEGASAGLFARLVKIAQELGFASVYVLVDKVDETSLTGNNPGAAFQLLEPLILDLPTLETKGAAFKFFLWDQLEELSTEAGLRKDRIQVSRLAWKSTELTEMLSRRLSAFSGRAVESFNDLLDPQVSLDVHALLAELNSSSPRDMIRMASQIVAEHTRQPGSSSHISYESVLSGIYAFSQSRSDELFAGYMNDLRRLPDCSFTITKLASDVFKLSTQAVRNKVSSWVSVGAVEKIGEQSEGAKPIHYYALKDPRLAIAISSPASVANVLGQSLFTCGACGRTLIVSSHDLPCPDCGSTIADDPRPSLRESCVRAL